MKTTVCAGTSLEPKLPIGENASDWTISRDTKLAWLAGIIDGEGSIGVSGWKKKIVKRVTVTNTDYFLLREITLIYKAMNLRFHITYHHQRNGSREYMAITVCSYGSIKKLLNAILPYLVGKRDQAKKMLEFISYRESIPYFSTDFGTGDKFKAFIDELQEMKRPHFGLSTTARVASQPLPEMVVQSGLQ